MLRSVGVAALLAIAALPVGAQTVDEAAAYLFFGDDLKWPGGNTLRHYAAGPVRSVQLRRVESCKYELLIFDQPDQKGTVLAARTIDFKLISDWTVEPIFEHPGPNREQIWMSKITASGIGFMCSVRYNPDGSRNDAISVCNDTSVNVVNAPLQRMAIAMNQFRENHCRGLRK